jgi:membrane-associated protein
MFAELTSFIESSVSSLLTSKPLLAVVFVFLIIFCETGLVVTPFLPGDSLLFILGALLSLLSLKFVFLFIFALSLAAILGNIINYSIGKYVGSKIISKGWINPEYLTRTENFYKKHGAKTIFISRFFPIIRTIAPFVAGFGKMDFRKFFVYNILGGISWILIFLLGGYFFGSIPFIKENLSIVMFIIIIVSIIPAIIHFIKSKS